MNSLNRLWICRWLGVGFFLLTGCQTTWPQAVPRKVHLDHSITVPMQVISHLPIVSVRINGHGPFHMILDTGSDLVVLRPPIVKQLRLPPGAVSGTRFTRSASGVQRASYCHIRQLQLGDATFEALDAKRLALPADYLGPEVTIDGLLGLRMFDTLLLTLDYPGKKLTLEPDAYLGAEEPHVIGARLQDGKHLVVDLPIGQTSIACILDTGTGMGLFLYDKDARKLHFSHGPIVAGTAATPHGQVQMRVGRVREDLHLADHLVRRPIVYLRPDEYPLISQTSLEPLFGEPHSLIGGQILSHFVLTIDQASRLIRWETSETRPLRLQKFALPPMWKLPD